MLTLFKLPVNIYEIVFILLDKVADSMKMDEIKRKFLASIEGKMNIVISTHSFPDADGIGSEISLCMALNSIGKNSICCNDEKLLQRYKYLDPQNVVTHVDEIESRYSESPDLIIVVDTNAIERTGKRFEAYAKHHGCPIIYIDHHPCKNISEKEHCIDTTAAATGQLIGELIIGPLGLNFTAEMALPLYTAILIDTSSFRYPTVTTRTHEIIAMLMATGIQPPAAYNGIYGTKKVDHLHLLGKVLATADSTKNEEVCWLVLTHEIITKYDVDIEDTHGFINNLLILDHAKVVCMFRDDGDKVKVSLRSSGDYDVGTIAVALGGGGHSHSAATLVNKRTGESIDEVIKSVVEKITKELHS